MNRVFASDMRMEGVMFGKSLLIFALGEKVSLVVSQPWVRAADPANPHPTAKEIDEFMSSIGFAKLQHSYFGWRREEDGVSILDARPDNFIKSSFGVVPIDLVASQ